MLIQPQRHIGIFSRIGNGLRDRHLVKGDLVLAAAQKLLNRNWRMAQIFLRQRVHAVAVIARIKRIRHQHGVVKAVQHQPVTLQNLRVKFGILQNLFHRRIGQKRLQ